MLLVRLESDQLQTTRLEGTAVSLVLFERPLNIGRSQVHARKARRKVPPRRLDDSSTEPYGRHSFGNKLPAFSGSSFTPATSAARARTGSRCAARSSAVGNRLSSGVTPVFSRLLPSLMIKSATVMLLPKYST